MKQTLMTIVGFAYILAPLFCGMAIIDFFALHSDKQFIGSMLVLASYIVMLITHCMFISRMDFNNGDRKYGIVG